MNLVSGLTAIAALVGGLVAGNAERAQQAPLVEYPTDYRSWTHVKSTVIGAAHPGFAANGGFQHVYANAAAMEGYRTRRFPEGSVIVFDWLSSVDSAGALREAPRRQTDVMVRDSVRFASTGGWGFQRFAGTRAPNATPALVANPSPQQCYTCHSNLQKDGLVLSHYRQ